MTSKSVLVSSDSGTTWHLLPGSSGALDRAAGSITDTIFGQDYESHEAGLISWTVHGQAIQKGQAGYKAKILQIGASTAFTGEATTLVSGWYEITAKAKSIWNRATSITVLDGVTDVTAQVEHIDYLFGRVKFLASYTVVAAITITGHYFPTVELGCSQSFSLKQTANALDVSCFEDTSANGGFVTNDYGLKLVSLDVSAIYVLADGFGQAMLDRKEFVIEINPDGLGLAGGGSVARGFYRLVTNNLSGNVGALEIDALTFELNVPFHPENIAYPFGWIHGANTLLSKATIATLNAWQNKTKVNLAYSSYGAEGEEGVGIVTDATMTSGMAAMVDFACVYTGDGALTEYATPKVISP